MIYIKYSGSINSKETINQLVEEFVDICRISGWDYEVVKENFQTMTTRTGIPKQPAEDSLFPELEEDLNTQTLSSSEVYLEGIIIKLKPDRDPIKFTFDRRGKLASISFSTADTAGFTKKLTIKKYEFLYFPYIKLFTSDADHHSQVVKLLDYVKKRYIKDLEVMDASFYWEHRDVEELKVMLWKSTLNRQTII